MADVVVLTRTRSNPAPDFGLLRVDLRDAGDPVAIRFASRDSMATFRSTFSVSGIYKITASPPENFRVMFFAPDDRKVPFFSEVTGSDGIFTGSFGSGDTMDIAVMPAKEDGNWPRTVKIRMTGPISP